MRLAERLTAPLLDGLLVAGSIWLLPLLKLQFAAPSFASVWLVLAAYLGLCAGMWLLKLIERPAARPPKTKDDPGCLPFLSFAFSIFALTMLMLSTGLGENTPQGDAVARWPEEHPVGLFVGSILLLVWVCLFPGVVMAQPAPRLPAGSARALAARVAGVLAVNSMVLVTAAWWQALLAGAEPGGFSVGARILLSACFYTLFLMFYAPPRLALLALDGDKLSLVTFLAVLAWIVWPLTA